jgi:hypothetical protein
VGRYGRDSPSRSADSVGHVVPELTPAPAALVPRRLGWTFARIRTVFDGGLIRGEQTSPQGFRALLGYLHPCAVGFGQPFTTDRQPGYSP